MHEAALLTLKPAFKDMTEDTLMIFEWFNKVTEFDSCMLILRHHTDCINAVTFSPDGAWFASASSDNSIKVHDGVSAEIKIEVEGSVRSVASQGNGRLFVTAGVTGIVRVWDNHSGVQTCEMTDLAPTVVNAVGFSCDDTMLAAAGESLKVAIYKLSADRLWALVGWLAGTKIVSSLAWHPTDPHWLVTGEGGQPARRANNGDRKNVNTKNLDTKNRD